MEISIKWGVCRVCLTSDKSQLLPLFNDAKLTNIIQDCSGRALRSDDGMPNKICKGCLDELKVVRRFIAKYKKSDDHIKLMIQSTMSTKTKFAALTNNDDDLDDEEIPGEQDESQEAGGDNAFSHKLLLPKQNKDVKISNTKTSHRYTKLTPVKLSKHEECRLKLQKVLTASKYDEIVADDSDDIAVASADVHPCIDLNSRSNRVDNVDEEHRNDVVDDDGVGDSINDELNCGDYNVRNDENESEHELEFMTTTETTRTTMASTKKTAQKVPDMADNNNEIIVVLNKENKKFKCDSLNGEEYEDDNNDEFDDDEVNYLECMQKSEEASDQIVYRVTELDDAKNNSSVYIIPDMRNIDQLIEHDDGLQTDVGSTSDVKTISELLLDEEMEDQEYFDIASGEADSNSEQLKSHFTHICSICKNGFPQASTLKIHMRLHRAEKKYACELCNKLFGSSHNLVNHMRTHTGEKPFKCQYCDRRFADRSTHIKHIRVHTNEKPFGCKICGKKFSLSSTLKTHKATHSDSKPYSCTTCQKSFKLSHQLKAHLTTYAHKVNSVEFDNI